LRALEELM